MLKTKTCKFCSMPEGFCGPSGRLIHINNRGICAPCYTIIRKVAKGVCSDEEKAWFVDMCAFNKRVGMYVPKIRKDPVN